jgi:hypothetical protein
MFSPLADHQANVSAANARVIEAITNPLQAINAA